MAFQNNLEHARAAYRFCVSRLPSPDQLVDGPIELNGFRFDKESQIHSMLIELGWAFYCRYESVLESHLKLNDVTLSKKVSLTEWLERNNVEIPEEYRGGLEVYRRIRNQLHHEDGKSRDDSEGDELHLLPQHMENFYELFLWCGHKAECAG